VQLLHQAADKYGGWCVQQLVRFPEEMELGAAGIGPQLQQQLAQ